MLYQLKTNDISRSFNFSLQNRGGYYGGEPGLDGYERLSERDLLTSDVPDLTVRYLKKALDPALFHREWYIQTHNRRKAVPPERIPDFWTTDPFPTVSRECKAHIEEMDPGVHQFIPLQVWDGKNDELYTHTEYFRFMCGRLIEIPPQEEPISESQIDLDIPVRAPSPLQLHEARIYGRIAARPDIQAILESYPIWRFDSVTYEGRPFGSRRVSYANKAFVKGAQKLGLKGFKETSPERLPKDAINPNNKTYYTQRDVNHVWYG